MLAMLVPATARAQSAAAIALDPTNGPVGTSVQVAGSGFQPGTVSIHLDQVSHDNELASVLVTRSGFQVGVTIPTVGPGSHTIIACRDRSSAVVPTCRERADATFRVVAPTSTSRPPTTPPLVTPTPPPPTQPPPGDVVGPSTTAGPPSTVPPQIADPNDGLGPDPTFDPTPDDLAGQTTTSAFGVLNPGAGEFPDLSVRAIEVTQGIQNLQSRMPLVASRRTYVRVHPDAEGFSWGPVDGLLLLRRSGLPDVILKPENGPVFTERDRADLDSALNFLLPTSYLGSGDLEITAGIWAFDIETLTTSEPDPSNNIDSIEIELHDATEPNVWLLALDDGGGPGPTVTNWLGLIPFAVVTNQDLLDLHPLATPTFDFFPEIVAPGPEASEPGFWILDDTGAQRSEPNQRMQWYANAFELFDTGFVLGAFDESIPAGGYTGWASYSTSWSKPVAETPAHELGHNQGLQHVGCKDDDDDDVPDELEGGAVDPKHPTGIPPVCSLAPISPNGYFGLTVYRDPLTIYSNDPTHPAAAFPFMSYQNPKWTDPYHWCLLLEAYDVPCNPAAIGVPAKVLVTVDCDPEPVTAGGFQLELCLIDELPPPSDPELPPPPGGAQDGGDALPALVGLADGSFAIGSSADVRRADLTLLLPDEVDRWVTVTGWLDLQTAAGEIRQGAVQRRFAAATRRAAESIPPRVQFTWGRLVVKDVAGNIVAMLPVDPDGAGHGGDSVRGTSMGIFEVLPWPEGASAVELVVDGVTVDRLVASNTEPTVEAVTATVSDDGVHVAWEAFDPDGDELLATVAWSADGETWLPLRVGITGDEVTIDSEVPVPGGDEVLVRVEVNDGLLTATATSEPFSAPTRGPEVFVSGLEPGDEVPQHELVELLAHAIDPEEGNLDGDAISWTSDRDGDLGTGRIMSTRDLALGTHTIRVAAVDADGNEATEEIEVTVLEADDASRYAEPIDDGAAEWLATGNIGALTADGERSWWPIVLVLAGFGAIGGVVFGRRRTARRAFRS